MSLDVAIAALSLAVITFALVVVALLRIWDYDLARSGDVCRVQRAAQDQFEAFGDAFARTLVETGSEARRRGNNALADAFAFLAANLIRTEERP